MDTKRTWLILIALFCGGAIPIQLATVSFGYAQLVEGLTKMPEAIPVAHTFAAGVYIPFVLVPALIVFAFIMLHSYRHYPDIYHRITVGAVTGAVATMALDVVRLSGVVHGWLPMDTEVLFGRMITGSQTFEVLYPVGIAAHYMFGADFGIFFAFVIGRGETRGRTVMTAVAWALLIELGMMTLPPMAPAVGMFGVDYKWPQLFLLTLTAHVFFGIALGLLAHHFLRDEARGGIFRFLRGPQMPTRSDAA